MDPAEGGKFNSSMLLFIRLMMESGLAGKLTGKFTGEQMVRELFIAA
jgi:hypothetical protein